VPYNALTLKHNTHPANTKGAALTPAVNTKENTAIPTADTKEATSSTHFISSQWKRPDLNRRRTYIHSKHKGRCYSNYTRELLLHKGRPLLLQSQEEAAVAQEKAATSVTTNTRKPFHNKQRGRSHSIPRRLLPQEKTRRPHPQ